ncbi:MAG: metal-sensitive transcriptional regulator [Gammaproteobacteria bacterium]|nr:metal-sensitive transcriptional regulator [Gammaproteobacteria bacterium]
MSPKATNEKRVVQPRKKALLSRMKRIEGQVRGVYTMIEEDRYCIDVLTQIAALRSALGAVSLQLLEDHTRHCVSHAIKHNDDAVIEELIEVTRRLTR